MPLEKHNPEYFPCILRCGGWVVEGECVLKSTIITADNSNGNSSCQEFVRNIYYLKLVLSNK